MNVIRQAVQNLPGHWYQGSMRGPNATACGFGHVSQVFYQNEGLPHDSQHVALSYMNVAAGDKFPERAMSPWSKTRFFFPYFNDHPDTTEQDVIDVMTLAADRWDIEHVES